MSSAAGFNVQTKGRGAFVRSIKTQFFLTFSAMGALLPYLPVFLDERGLSKLQIGYVQAAMALTGLASPVIVTLMADLKVTNRMLLGVLLALSAATAAMMVGLESYWPLLIAAATYQLATAPKNPLQDVLYFREFEVQEAHGGSPPRYHRIRVWGTIGFILPSLLLYPLLHYGLDVQVAVVLVAILNILAMLNTFFLPSHRHAQEEIDSAASGAAAGSPTGEPANIDAHAAASPAEATGGPADAHIDVEPDYSAALAVRRQQQLHSAQREAAAFPTWTAARTLFTGRMLAFCLAMFFAHMAAAVYYGFYPLYLTEQIGIPNEWVGLIVSLGVVLEIGFMLGYGWMIDRFGVRNLVLLGGSALLVRMILLTLFPVASIAIATQTLHGLTVLLVHVVPPLWLNRHALASNRNSIQGLFVMIVWGGGRIAGNLVGGYLSEFTLLLGFAAAAVLALLSLLLLVVFFPSEKNSPATQEPGTTRRQAPASQTGDEPPGDQPAPTGP